MLLVALILLLILLNMPVGLAFLTGAAWVYGRAFPIAALAQRITGVLTGSVLLTVPFFMLLGAVMNRGGIARRIFAFAESLAGPLPGGLAQVNVITNLILAGMSSSAGIIARGAGEVEIHGMTRAGFPRSFAAAVLASSAIIGPIIPPSIILVVYGVLAGIEVRFLLLAGVLPGMLMAASLMAAVYLVAKNRGYPLAFSFSPKSFRQAVSEGFWALLTPLLLLLGITLSTPEEAGAVVLCYSLVVSTLIYRDLTWQEMPAILEEVGLRAAAVLLLMASAEALGWALSWLGVTQLVARVIAGLILPNWALLLLVNLTLLVAGMFIPGLVILALTVPLFRPLCFVLGMEPAHFAIMVTVNLTIGALTPPVGPIGLAAALMANVPYGEFLSELGPFLAALLAALLLISYFPEFSLLIPSWLLGG
ncbi:MAG: TRAP transporter large permease [Limnochordia bacterium]|jgi:tripartite ATP-independent transporter DctM subunit